MRIESWASVTTVCLMLFGTVLSAERQPCPDITAAQNVELMADLDGVFQRIYRRSATFRSQWQRIAAAANLRVRVRIDNAIPSSYRAFTVVQRRGREVWAEVHLPPGGSLTELIAHELEHLLEQVEGLDLRELARVRGSGVREIERELFETERAAAAGRLVAQEMHRPPQAPAAD